MAGGQVYGVAGSIGNFARDKLSKEVRKLGQPLMRYRQFTKKQNDYGKHEGQVLYFPKRLNLSADASTGAIVAERGAIPTAGYSTLQGTCTARKSAIKVPYTLEAELFSEVELDRENREALTDFMAKALNYRTYNEGFNATNVLYIPTGTDAAPAATWDVDGTASTAATRDIQIFDLKNIVDAMKAGLYGTSTSAPVQTYDGANYQQIAAVSACRAYRDDDEWEEAARFGDPERLWAGELGRIYMTRTVEDNHILGLNNGYKGEAFIFGKDPVMECVALLEEIRFEVPAELQTDYAVGFVYVGGFAITWVYNATTQPDNRVVKITSS